MSTMIEKVARALDPMSAKVADMLLENGLQRKDVLAILPMDKARAAIEAMREPTDGMVDIMNDTPIDGPGYESFNPSMNDCREIWTAGVNAALNEQVNQEKQG